MVGSWSTPVVIQLNGRDQTLCSTTTRVIACDLKTRARRAASRVGSATAWLPRSCAHPISQTLRDDEHPGSPIALAQLSPTACGSRRSLPVAPSIRIEGKRADAWLVALMASRTYRDALRLIHEQGAKLPITESTIKRLHRLCRGQIWDAGLYKEKDVDITQGEDWKLGINSQTRH